MIELTYRRKQRVHVKIGVGAPPVRDQIPDDATLISLEGRTAHVIYPSRTEVFKSQEHLDAVAHARGWNDSNFVEVSRRDTSFAMTANG